ncbi:hypothetical protein [Paenibacillus odorifer]|nr:hypothetical protein [Paenibacillus odorifer]
MSAGRYNSKGLSMRLSLTPQQNRLNISKPDSLVIVQAQPADDYL